MAACQEPDQSGHQRGWLRHWRRVEMSSTPDSSSLRNESGVPEAGDAMSSPIDRPPNPWTILVFMAVDEDALAPYALIDLRDIKRLGNLANVNIAAEVRWHDSAPERYELRDGALALVEEAPRTNA